MHESIKREIGKLSRQINIRSLITFGDTLKFTHQTAPWIPQVLVTVHQPIYEIRSNKDPHWKTSIHFMSSGNLMYDGKHVITLNGTGYETFKPTLSTPWRSIRGNSHDYFHDDKLKAKDGTYREKTTKSRLSVTINDRD